MPSSPPPQWLPPGTCIGHYRVEQLISSGGFGVVYRVSRDGQNFALKLPLPLPQPPAPADERPRGEPPTRTSGPEESLRGDGGARSDQRGQNLPSGGQAQRGAGNENDAEDRRALEQRIVREVVSLMTLNHPNIVRVHGFDRWPSPTSGALYLVMDFVEGVPLLQWRRNERPTVREVVRLFQTLALALDLMHRLGVVHRDIKSANVLVAPHKGGAQAAAWKPVLVDFGLARPAFTTDVTKEFVLLGTEGLWAPEHAAFGEAAFTRGARFKFTPATDLHALGLLFYQALTGRRALAASSRDLAAVVTEVVRPPSAVAPSLPEALDGPLLRLLAKKPEERPLTGAALSEELDALLATADERWDCAVPPSEPPPPEPAHVPTTPQRPDRPPPALKGPEPAPAGGKPPPFLARSVVRAAEPPPSAAPSTTVRIAAPPPPPRRTRQRLRRVVVALGCVLALGFGTAVGLWAGASATHSARRADPLASVAVAPEPVAPQIRPASRTKKPPAAPPTRAAAASTSSTPRALPPEPAPAQPAGKAKPGERAVVRAGVTGPVRVGTVEAVLREPFVSRGLIVLPVGTAVVGAASPLEDGGFALRFSTARTRSGAITSVDGTGRLEARAGQRQPLRPGSLPQQFDFDLSLALEARKLRSGPSRDELAGSTASATAGGRASQ